MARKRYSDEDVLKLLREIDVHCFQVFFVIHVLIKRNFTSRQLNPL